MSIPKPDYPKSKIIIKGSFDDYNLTLQKVTLEIAHE